MNVNLASRICEFLNAYLFENVWNEPYREYRRNIIPQLLSVRPVSSTWTSKSRTTPLPSNRGYYIYNVPSEAFHGINIGSSDWINLSSYLSTSKLELRVHGRNGEMLYRPLVYIKSNPMGDGIMLAIDQLMAAKILGDDYDFSVIYFSVYFDSDIPRQLTLSCDVATSLLKIQQIFALYEYATLFLVNGQAVRPTVATDIKIGSYVEVVIDENVIANLTIDLPASNPTLEYFSTIHNQNYTIVHIPKQYNPLNEVITFNTCDLFIRPLDIQDAEKFGLYLHYCYNDKIIQLTHNDFAIPNSVLDIYRNLFGTQHLELTVLVRDHSKNNRLIRDADYIDLLYAHDDATILQFLTEQSGLAFSSFWSANHLETSEYIAMMFDVPNIITPSNMGKYIDALGYNHVLALICQRIHRLTINEAMGHEFYIYTPIIFESLDVMALVYIDGLKIADNKVTVTRVDASKIKIKLDNSVNMPNEKTLIIELFERKASECYEFNPTTNTTSLVLPFSEFDLYEVRNLTYFVNSVNTMTSLGYTGTTLQAATLISDLTSYGVVIPHEGGGCTFSAFPFCNGKKFRFYNKHDNRCIFTTSFDIDNYIGVGTNKALVSGQLRVSTNINTQVPLLGNFKAMVFLNGKTLIDGIDYNLGKYKSDMNQPAFYEVILQNVSYLKKEANYLEVYITKDIVLDVSTGFVTGSQINYVGDATYWFDNISMLSIDGNAIAFPKEFAGLITIDTNTNRNGAPYGIRTIIPQEAYDYVNIYRSDTDTARLLNLRDYFYHRHPLESGIVVIPCSHNVYSVFLTTILNDVLSGTKLLTYIADPTTMLRQVKEYSWLKAYDIVFTTSEYDLRYLDIYPTFRRNETTDRNIYRCLTHLMNCALQVDTIKDGDDINELK